MTRFVLRFSGPAVSPEHRDRIRSFAKVRVLDDAPKMFLVEGKDADVQELVTSLPDWKATAEH